MDRRMSFGVLFVGVRANAKEEAVAASRYSSEEEVKKGSLSKGSIGTGAGTGMGAGGDTDVVGVGLAERAERAD